MKIVISGPTGSGKTSLATALAEKLSLPLIAEDMRPIYQAKQRWVEARRSQPDQAPEVVDARRQWAITFAEWVNQRRRLYAAHQQFVADRWEADLVGLWLRLFADTGMDDITRQLMRDMRRKAQMLDGIVMLPMLDLAAPIRNEDGLSRNARFSVRVLSSLVTDGLIRQCPGVRRILVPDTLPSIIDRVDWVVSALAKRQHPASAG